MEDRRISERIAFNPHVAASVTSISKSDMMVVDEGCILDASLDGLKILLNKELEKGSEVVVCTMFPIVNRNLVLQGTVVHVQKRQDGPEFEYGVELFLSEDETKDLLDFFHTSVEPTAKYVKCARHKDEIYVGPNRRNSFRFQFSPHAKGIMSIFVPGLYRYDWKETEVCVLNISAVGVRICSDKDFAIDTSMLLTISMRIFDSDISFTGRVVRKEQDRNRYFYAMSLISTQADETFRAGLVNKLVAAKRNGSLLQHYAACSCPNI